MVSPLFATRRLIGSFALAVLLSAGAAAPASAQTGGGKPPQTDQTVQVTKGARLTVDNHAGEVFIRGWDKDAVRVQARHPQRTRVAVRTVAAGVAISSSSTHAPAAVDYEINVPVWMAIKVDGHYAYIDVEGTTNEVAADTVRGDISIKGGSGFVAGKSVEGEVKVSGARGRVSVNSINQGVSVENSSGDIVAETVNGPIRLTGIDAESVEATTVNGNVAYEGSAQPRGRYRFSSHNGNIAVGVPETAGASFSVRTYNGSINTNLPIQRSGEGGRGRRVLYTMGNGSAEFELESFGGTIQLRRQGTLPARAKGKDKEE